MYLVTRPGSAGLPIRPPGTDLGRGRQGGDGMRTLGGRYELVRRIGVGGMSEVWHGHDQVLDRPVAVKIMTPARAGTLGGESGVDSVRTEARSAARLAHPNVAGVHDFGTSESDGVQVPYIVM